MTTQQTMQKVYGKQYQLENKNKADKYNCKTWLGIKN